MHTLFLYSHHGLFCKMKYFTSNELALMREAKKEFINDESQQI